MAIQKQQAKIVSIGQVTQTGNMQSKTGDSIPFVINDMGIEFGGKEYHIPIKTFGKFVQNLKPNTDVTISVFTGMDGQKEYSITKKDNPSLAPAPRGGYGGKGGMSSNDLVFLGACCLLAGVSDLGVDDVRWAIATARHIKQEAGGADAEEAKPDTPKNDPNEIPF